MDIDFVIDDAANHVKRIEVIRPRGNAVVFDFAWDDETQSFSATGYPTGIDSSRLYVLRALSPTDDSSLNYQLLFPSGIVQTFGGTTGGLQSVGDANSGLVQVAGGALVTDDVATDAGLGDPIVPDSSRYEMSLGWADGRISAVDYTTDPTKLNTTAGPATIETNLGYEGNGNRIVSLDKTNGTAAGGNAVAIPEFSYTAEDPGAILGGGFETDRTSSTFIGGSAATIQTFIDGVSGYTEDSYIFNSDGLVTNAGHSLAAPDGTATGVGAVYTYQPRPEPGSANTSMDNRYADNGAAMWGKVQSISYSDGPWEQFAYDTDTGWLIDDVTPFKNSAMQSTALDSADDGRDTSYSYSNDLLSIGYQGTGFPAYPEVGDAADVTMLVAAPRVTATMVEGITTGMTMAAYHSAGALTVETRQASSNSGATWANASFDTTTTITGYNSFTTQQGVAKVVSTSSDLGDSSVVSYGSTTLSSAADVYNGFGGLVYSSSSGLGQTPVATTATPSVDSYGRVLSAAVTGGLTSSVQSYGWFGPTAATGPDNVQTTYTYTPLGQILTATALGVTTTDSYDAAGNVVHVHTAGSAGNNGSANPGIVTDVYFTYDAQGRLRMG